MNIYMAEREELPVVVDLIMKRAEEFDFEKSGFPLPEKSVVADTVFINYMLSPCFVAKNDEGEIIGCASTSLSSFGWSKVPYLSTFMLYVLPDKRNIDIVKSLYTAIKDYADLQGILYVDDYIAIDRVDARRRLMRSMGFNESGFLLTYNGSM